MREIIIGQQYVGYACSRRVVGEAEYIDNRGCVKLRGYEPMFHPKQLRKLKKKLKRGRWGYADLTTGILWTFVSWETARNLCVTNGYKLIYAQEITPKPKDDKKECPISNLRPEGQ